MTLEKYIRDIVDFPKKGIFFKDITPFLSSSEATAECLQFLLESLSNQKIDKVVGVEHRGFFFATLLAQELKAGLFRSENLKNFLLKPFRRPMNWNMVQIRWKFTSMQFKKEIKF